jgi:YidC/Oxa1 family membrane protein insertase
VINAVADVLARLLQWLQGLTGSYVVAIILVTVAVKLVLHPLTRKQLQSMRAMQALAPQMTALREKYRDNPQQLNKEMMDLYRAHGVNPFGGCLPLVAQLPILWGLFTLFRRPGIFQGASALGVPLDRVPCTSGPLSAACWLAMIQEPVFLGVIVLVALTTYLQQRVSMTDPQQARMFVLMPIIFAVFAISFPFGLSIYWIVYSVVGTLEYYLVQRLPTVLPQAPPEVVLSQRPKGSKKK